MTNYIPNIWYDRLDGIQVTRDNANSIAKNLGGEILRHLDNRLIIVVPTSRGRVMLNEGDWITKESNSDRYRIVELVETTPEEVFKSYGNPRELRIKKV